MKQLAFVAGNDNDVWAYVRNLGNMLNVEHEVLVKEKGVDLSVNIRLRTMRDVVYSILEQKMLPGSAEGFDQVSRFRKLHPTSFKILNSRHAIKSFD